MRWFVNMKTGTKLSVGFFSLLILLLAVIFVARNTVAFIEESGENLYSNSFSVIEQLRKLNTNLNVSRVALLSMMQASNKADQDPFYQEILGINKERGDILNAIEQIKKDDVNFMKKYAVLTEAINNYLGVRDKQIIPAILNNTPDVITQLQKTQQDNFVKMTSATEDLINYMKDEISTELSKNKTEAQKTNTVFIVIGSAATVLSILLIFILNHLIALPLKEISSYAKRIADGDLTILNIGYSHRKDEVGVLAKTFKLMITNLRQLTLEISEVVNMLGSAASEIASATTELSSGAAETATSVGETTSTIEEVKQTSQVANQKAKAVLETAQRSAEVSQSGKNAANDINEMINQIHTQMESIAESMVRLSAQGQAIGTIISAVDDLSQQSNLLAVNASIEAAKAGDQGKGFAVVAQEVKSLASQSKEATNKIRGILNDIQKATTSAVMATEQGTKAVNVGVQKSNEAGQSILALVNSVTEASHAATQIAAVSHQQLVGMEQSAIAMENIKQASDQNVESSKQLDIAIHNIKDLGDRLQKLISQYKLKATGTE